VFVLFRDEAVRIEEEDEELELEVEEEGLEEKVEVTDPTT